MTRYALGGHGPLVTPMCGYLFCQVLVFLPNLMAIAIRDVTRPDSARYKKQVWRPHVRALVLSHAILLYWKSTCGIAWSFGSAPPPRYAPALRWLNQTKQWLPQQLKPTQRKSDPLKLSFRNDRWHGSNQGVTTGKGSHNYPGAESLKVRQITAGSAEKSQLCHKHFLEHSTFAPEGSNMWTPNLFLAPDVI